MSTNENKGKKAEVTALQAISAEDRKDWISLAFVQAGICVCVPAFLLGALLAEAMPIWPAIISGSLGYLIVVVGMVATGMIGCDLGLASCTCCQAGFGKSGARFIVSTIFAVNMIGWFGIQNGVCGEAFSNAMLAMTGWDIPVVVSNTIWGIIMLLTAVYGVHALEKLDKISIPLLMIIMCYGIFLAFKVYGTGNLNDEGTVQSMSFMSGVALSFNFTAVGTITGPDYTRFQKSRKDTVKSVFYGVFPMGVITLIMGIVLTKLSGGAYQQAISVLYAVAYTLRMSYKTDHKIAGFFEYVVPPLEGFWWQENIHGVNYADKDSFNWISVIRLPDFVNQKDFEWAVETATKKKKIDCSSAEFVFIDEGLCVQIMHLGAFDDEPATVALMDAYLEQNGYVNDMNMERLHHEIYLSDARKVAPEKWKTVIRHPIKKL